MTSMARVKFFLAMRVPTSSPFRPLRTAPAPSVLRPPGAGARRAMSRRDYGSGSRLSKRGGPAIASHHIGHAGDGKGLARSRGRWSRRSRAASRCRPPPRSPRGRPGTGARRRPRAAASAARRRLPVAGARLRRGREGDRVVAAPVAEGRARARQGEDAAGGQPLEVARGQGGVGGHHHHARAIARRAPAAGPAADRRSSRPTGTPSMVSEAPVVDLHQHPDRVPAVAGRQHARGGSDPALPAEGPRPRARPDRAFRDRAPGGGADRGEHVAAGDPWRPRMSLRPPSLVSPTSGVHGPHVLIVLLRRARRPRPPSTAAPTPACW